MEYSCKVCGHGVRTEFIGGKWFVMCNSPVCKPGAGVGRPLSDGEDSQDEAMNNYIRSLDEGPR